VREDVALLRQALAKLETPALEAPVERFTLGVAGADGSLGGGLARGALHEIHAVSPSHAPAASGFAGALLRRAASGRICLWIRHDYAELEMGSPYGPGLVELGLDPRRLVLARVKHPRDALRAAADAAACSGVGGVLLEIWGEPPALDLTATRKLALTAAASGVTVLMARAQAPPAPSAAATRWTVASAPSRALEGDAPGRPSFAVTLERSRRGASQRSWIMEWDRDRGCFDDAALSCGVAALPVDGPREAGAGSAARRRSG
jgi:protein ImuA